MDLFCNLSKRKTVCIVITLSLFITFIMAAVFFFLKKGYYGDEVYSYATSNSSETMSPLLDFDGSFHLNEWIDTKFLTDSVILSRDEVFNYSHINEILRDDAHPPLYFYILHFFSSFFLGKFSWFPSVIINSISIFVMLIYFYRLFLLLSYNRFLSFLGTVSFGLSSSLINYMTFSRNYTLMTAFTLLFTFYIFKSMKFNHRSRDFSLSLVLSSIFLFLAAVTQYLSIVYAFFLTLFICGYYLIKKDIQSMLKTGLSMSASIIFMVLLYHDVIHQLTNDQSSMDMAEDYPYLFQLRISFHILFDELFGIKTPIQPTMFFFWLFWGIAASFIIYLIMSFLFRTDEWFINFRRKLSDFIKTFCGKLKNQRVCQYFFLFASCLICVFIISYKFKIYYFYPLSDRYLFFIMPFTFIIMVLPVFYVLKRKPVFPLFLAFTLIILSLSSGSKNYLYRDGLSMNEVKALTGGSDVIIYGRNPTSITTCLLHIADSSRIFVTSFSTFNDNISKLAQGVSDDVPLYILYEWSNFSYEDQNDMLSKNINKLDRLGVITLKTDDIEHSVSGVQVIGYTGSYLICRFR